MRKRLASALIRLAHRIYRPTVEDLTPTFRELFMVGEDGTILCHPLMPPERRESRGWERQ